MDRVTKSILIDAVRRQEIEGGVFRTRMTCLATPSAAKRAVELGYIKPSCPPESKGVLNWYDLTDAGLIKCGDIRLEMGIVPGEARNTQILWEAI